MRSSGVEAIQQASVEACELMKRYRGEHPVTTYKVCPFTVAHWLEISTMELEENIVGLELTLSRSSRVEPLIEFIPNLNDLNDKIAFAIGVIQLKLISEGDYVDIYNWGNLLPPFDEARAIAYGQSLIAAMEGEGL